MNIVEQLALTEQLEHLWKGLLPGIGIPDRSQFLIWVGKYPEQLLVAAFNRTARKVRKMRDTAPMSLLDCVKYATSVATHEKLNEHSFS